MKDCEIVIVGGGLAGLTAAIHLADAGRKIKLYEKEEYPHHKVCGEYLSREIIPYLNTLNIPISSLDPVLIQRLVYSTPSGKEVQASLPLGGVGVSRYALDNLFYQEAVSRGVEIIKDTVTDINFLGDHFKITSSTGSTCAAIVLGAFGKRSLLDKKLERDFIANKTGWLAVKSHYKMKSYPDDIVSLHNFNGGYCGLSKTESGAVNVCYLATYKSFKKYKDPGAYQFHVLSKNKHLKRFFKDATPLFEKELTIAQVSFDKKSQVEDHILMLGDAAGLIHPLCGNGMAMAIHSAKLASECIIKHYQVKGFNRDNMEKDYIGNWNSTFRSRLQMGRVLQKILLEPALAEFSQHTLNIFPALLSHIIKRTHGKPVL